MAAADIAQDIITRLNAIGAGPMSSNALPVWTQIVEAMGFSVSTLTPGVVPPDASVGVGGGFYIDLASGLIYGPKSGTYWPIYSRSMLGSSYATLSTIGTTTAGWGSVKTKIARFVNANVVGSDLSITQSVTNGDSITCNTTGVYYVAAQILNSSSQSPNHCVTVNTLDAGTTAPFGNQISGEVCRFMSAAAPANGNGGVASRIILLNPGDILNLFGYPTQVYNSSAFFEVWRLA